ncbi:unnamed protein product [Adineta steineri]|uniref:Ubiquitin-like domain-containing protein n=1 Tax=Adineta steineri TaxID=433720 RepID=A0A819D379_9BILA|nr:unnamed protein product [Adineta steineri]CAF3839381.1 unnamed protein product [Adineta steineri]
MSDESTTAVVPDISNTHKNSITNETGDSSESTDQPPLKKSASNVPITLNIRYKTQTFSIECDLYDTLGHLKDKIDKLTDVEPQVQKLVNKSITSVKRDDTTTILKDLNLTDGQTLLLVGATRSEVSTTSGIQSTASSNKDSTDDYASGTTKKEPLCKQTKHEKILKNGKPENVQVGIRNLNEELPLSIEGLYMSMLNQSGKKARLTFKLELDELWINTAETTKKIPMTQIRNVVDEPIEGHDGYSIVGFQTGTTESQINSIAGATSGVLVSVLVSPLDVLKTRIQVKRLPKGVPDTPFLVVIYRLAQREGFRAFYKGLGVTMLGYVPNWAIYFSTYQWSKKQYASILSSGHYENDVLTNLLSSITAGAVANTVIAPMWTIRTRMMTQSNYDDYRNAFDAARKIYRTEGLYALYRGLVPSMLGLIHVGIQFPLYEYLKKGCLDGSSPDQRLSTGHIIFASSVSKLIASCVAYPHEIVRSRLQDAGHAQAVQKHALTPATQFREYKNVRDAVQTIAKDEGLRGFYRGLVPTLIRTLPAAVLTLLTYEKMKDFLGDNFGDNSTK